MALTNMEQAELEYRYAQVYNWLNEQDDFVYPTKAVEAFLDGSDNQSYMHAEIKWPVMRWRYLNSQTNRSLYGKS